MVEQLSIVASRRCAALLRLAALAVAALATPLAQAQAATLDVVKQRGVLRCGVQKAAPGLSLSDAQGRPIGLEPEFCRALAAAVLGSRDRVEVKALGDTELFQALASGEVDVLSGGASWTLSRDTELGARFAGAMFHESQEVMVRRSHAVSSALELSGASICVAGGSRSEFAIAAYFERRSMPFQLVVGERWEDVTNAYKSGGCTAVTADAPALAALRAALPDPDEHVMLPEVVAGKPHGPAVRQGDETWFAIVRWVLMALIRADELGITSANVDAMAESGGPEARHLLGREANIGTPIGLPQTWAYEVIRQVGNYSEMFERNLGRQSPFKLRRGLNGLWQNGGLLYAAPLR
ncbi:MAG: transporter substrate-binding domain-containing protein [Hyphomicrobiaceae bacterium]|nr:transporter substrate-binding domain-containing protein [Hyphomicrobiaceae bacterium]